MRNGISQVALHQVLPSFRPGDDGIGNHVLLLQDILRTSGVKSEIFAESISASGLGLARSFDLVFEEEADPDVSFLYHHSSGSPVADWFSRTPARGTLWFHNVTPPHFFQPWDQRATVSMASGLRQLHELARRASLSIAHSQYSARALYEAGAPKVAVIPPLIDFQRLAGCEKATLAVLSERKRSGGIDLLFVGRIAPHKAQHDLIRCLAQIRRSWDPHARLTLVGWIYSQRYMDSLRTLCRDEGVGEAVCFAGAVSDDVLAAHYAAADVFLSLSQHEGFGIPLVESMHSAVPVIAHENSAIGETLGGAGLLLSSREPQEVSNAVREVVTHPRRQQHMIRLGKRRAQGFSMTRTRQAVVTTLLPHSGRAFARGRPAKSRT